MHPQSSANISFLWKPRVVRVGELLLGNGFPIRIESMTNTDTMNTVSTVSQCIRLANAGCELVRITAQGVREAKQLQAIRKELHNAGYSLPLSADIHFNPEAAIEAARIVEQVRINPGNYADKRETSVRSFTNKQYSEELERVAERLYPLLKVCQEHGTAIRIGTNHGSLSGRIMHRYGDTIEGMAESAMEFVRICAAFGFHQLILSMKSSNVRVKIASTRLLVNKMVQESLMYPLHLGVTEAGNGIEGRIKSAAGIGTLLSEGIGDTIRVSLTEPPENEIHVAKTITRFYPKPLKTEICWPADEKGNPVVMPERRLSRITGTIGNNNVPVVLRGNMELWSVDENGNNEGNHGMLTDTEKFYKRNSSTEGINYLMVDTLSDKKNLVFNHVHQGRSSEVLIMRADTASEVSAARKLISELDSLSCRLPVIVSHSNTYTDAADFAIVSALGTAPLLNNGQGDGLYLINPELNQDTITRVAFAILQACRLRTTQNEYIACPGCGRTRYDLEGTLERVKSATAHLKGIKIAVMGCIVNGPGEMADADYGYIGQGRGKVSLYAGKRLVRSNIPENEAINALITLIEEQSSR
ncbi:MAG TPA: (E)-4-hydroxy-3-methylbut-2-enyl-diphosphate synthase [Bacteroidales bacterium]|nr:(E)-4-hydroxy-3-methylbut-2-enyl-diphosphate synthase [Bacteroidales bacterium]